MKWSIFSINRENVKLARSSYYSLKTLFPFLPISELPTERKILATLKHNAIISLFSTHRCIGTVSSTDPSWTTLVRSHFPFSRLRTNLFSSLSLSIQLLRFANPFHVFSSNLTSKPRSFHLFRLLVSHASIWA